MGNQNHIGEQTKKRFSNFMEQLKCKETIETRESIPPNQIAQNTIPNLFQGTLTNSTNSSAPQQSSAPMPMQQSPAPTQIPIKMPPQMPLPMQQSPAPIPIKMPAPLPMQQSPAPIPIKMPAPMPMQQSPAPQQIPSQMRTPLPMKTPLQMRSSGQCVITTLPTNQIPPTKLTEQDKNSLKKYHLSE